MRSCPSCGRALPDATGAPEQPCPRCGHVAHARELPPLASAPDPAGAAAAGWRAFLANYGALLGAWSLPVAVEAAGGLGLLAYAGATGLTLPQGIDTSHVPLEDQMRILGVALPLLLIVYTAKVAAWGLVAARVHAYLRPDAPAPRPQALPLVGLALALTLLYLAGLALFVVPFLVFFHWFLFAPAAVAEGRGVGDALDASRRFARDHRTYGFTALVLFVWAGTWLLGAIGTAPLARLLELAGLPAEAAGAVATPVAHAFLAPLVPALPAAYWALAGRAPQARPVRADAPAAERFRTTKCPDCGTLVPYTATGAPVDVECPVCGRRGRLL